jgi:hypothetical protein
MIKLDGPALIISFGKIELKKNTYQKLKTLGGCIVGCLGNISKKNQSIHRRRCAFTCTQQSLCVATSKLEIAATNYVLNLA